MGDQRSPRTVVKGLLRGEPPTRPLLMPLTFSLAAKLENLSMGSFATNPTKIANALRQIRAALKLDSVSCYCNPYLEIEALGGAIDWNQEGAVLAGRPRFESVDELREKAGSAAILKKGGVPVASEVLKRLKIMLNDEPVLMVSVTGPLKLAAQLADTPQGHRPPAALVEFSAEIVATLSQHFVEAGADQVFIPENTPLADSTEELEWWAGLLEPVVNVIRFYEALPMLLLDEATDSQSAKRIVSRNWDCVLCFTARVGSELGSSDVGARGLGLALPVTLFGGSEIDRKETLAMTRRAVDQVRPILLTSSADIPATADIKQVASILDQFREVHSSAG